MKKIETGKNSMRLMFCCTYNILLSAPGTFGFCTGYVRFLLSLEVKQTHLCRSLIIGKPMIISKLVQLLQEPMP